MRWLRLKLMLSSSSKHSASSQGQTEWGLRLAIGWPFLGSMESFVRSVFETSFANTDECRTTCFRSRSSSDNLALIRRDYYEQARLSLSLFPPEILKHT